MTGPEFFRALVRHLAGALGFRHALVAETLPERPGVVRTLAVWSGDDFGETMEYPLHGTPCEQVVGRSFCQHPRDVQKLFPGDRDLVRMGAESYVGMPLRGSDGGDLGLIALIHDAPSSDVPAFVEPVLRTFAARAAAELERLRKDQALGALLRRYRALAEASPAGIFYSDPDGRNTYVNARCAETTGVSPDESVGSGWARHLHPDDRERVWAEWARFLRDGDRFRAEYRFVHPDGRVVWSLTQMCHEYDAAGAVVGYVGTSTDITRRKRTEEELRTSEQRLRLLVGQIPAVLWTTDADLRFTSSEGAALQTLGLRPGQVVGVHFHDFFGTTDPEMPTLAAHLKALAGATSTYEQVWAGRTFHCHVEPLRGGADGAVIGTVGVALDITDRKRAERELREAHDQLDQRVRERTAELQRANDELTREIVRRQGVEAALRQSEEHFRELAKSNQRLLQEIDHRVRNNVAGLLSLVSMMREATPDVKAFADAIESRLRAMNQVHQLLAEGGWRPVGLEPLIRRLLDAVSSLWTCPGDVTLTGPAVEVSPRQTLPLSMILLEWFTNSCKYGAAAVAPGGRVGVTWEPFAAPSGQWVRLRWRESGGPPIREPVRPSLGTELVRSFAAVELKGRCELRFPGTGVDHTLEFPLHTGK